MSRNEHGGHVVNNRPCGIRCDAPQISYDRVFWILTGTQFTREEIDAMNDRAEESAD